MRGRRRRSRRLARLRRTLRRKRNVIGVELGLYRSAGHDVRTETGWWSSRGSEKAACLGGRQREVERMTRRSSPLSAGVTVAPQILSRCRVLLPHTLLALPSKRKEDAIRQTNRCLLLLCCRSAVLDQPRLLLPPATSSLKVYPPPKASYHSLQQFNVPPDCLRGITDAF